MNRIMRFHWVGRCLALLVTLSPCHLVTLPSASAAEATPDLAAREERQKQIQAETDRLVRRVETMIRVLEYNRLDKTAEKQMFDQIAGTLSGLSREQMTRLIAALEKASTAKGAARTKGLEEAQARHEQIVLGLKALLAKLDAVKSLDQAAERLDKMARDELDQYLQNVQLAWEDENQSSRKNREESRLRAERLAGEQGFVLRDLSDLLVQVAGLRSRLPVEQRERLRKMEEAVQLTGVLDNLAAVGRHLRALGFAENRRLQWRKGAEIQWRAAGDIRDLAGILRGAPDKLESLRDARRKIDRVLDEQEGVRQGTLTPPEKEKPDAKPEEMADLNQLWSRGLTSREAGLEFEVQVIRNLLQSHAEDLAGQLLPIEKAMREAQDALREQATRKPPITNAVKPQETAAAKLREVKTELDRVLAETEKVQSDPLANLKDTFVKVEQLISEQKDIRDKADEAGETGQTQRLPHLTAKQEALAERTDELRQQPTAATAETKQALDQAARAMDRAAKALQDKQALPSVAKQDQALAQLEEAKKALAEQMAEIEKRRREIAELEDADKKLTEMVKQEGEVAEEARDKAEKRDAADAKDLAQKQGALTPQAKSLGKQLEKSAPEAARHVEDSVVQMDAAKVNLDKQQLPPAAKNADKAVEKLKEAQRAAAKALEEKKGREAADQAAMQPDLVDPMNAARQIAKALEQTEKAAKESEQAAQQLGQKPRSPQRDLAKLQKDVESKTEKVEAPQAKEPASKAAEALEKGDLVEAVAQQEKALAQLQDAAEKKGQPSEEAPKEAPKPSDAKDAGELAQAQKAILEATKDRVKAQAAKQPEKTDPSLDQKSRSPQPDLAKQQEDVEQKTEKVEAPQAKEPAGEAAKALKEGDLKKAIAQQEKALAKLQDAAQKKGQQSEPSAEEPPKPNEAKNAGELAQAQKALLEATKDQAKAQAAKQSEKTDAPLDQKSQSPQPDLAKLQKEVEQKAEKVEAPQAKEPASKAAEALKKGDLKEAITQQEKALAKLNEAAQKKGQQSETSPKEAPKPNEAKNVRELAQAQKALLEATKDRAKAQAAEQTDQKAKTRSDLVMLQKQVAEKAEEVEAPQAKEPASEAAEALEKGDLKAAIAQQKKSLAELRDVAQDKGQPSEGQPRSAPMPSEAKNAGELAQAQKAILDMTEALTKPPAPKQPQQTAPHLAQKSSSEQPDLAALQKEVSQKAPKVEASQAKQPANDAAEALQKGDLKEAVAQQTKALARLNEVAQKKGQPSETSPMGAPMPREAKNAGELAQAQKALLEATKSLGKSQAATDAALAALAQAQAQAPAVVEPQLQKAGRLLASASQSIPQGKAIPAHESQGIALFQLEQALETLNSAMAKANGQGQGQEQGQGQGQGQARGQGQTPGQGQGRGQVKGRGQAQGQGQGQGQGQRLGPGREKNEGRGNGNRIADGQRNNGPAWRGDLRGDGLFIHLPPRQRELIKQALQDKLPPEYAALIQQYYIDIARGKPAAMTLAKPKP